MVKKSEGIVVTPDQRRRSKAEIDDFRFGKDFYVGGAVFWNCSTVVALSFAIERLPVWVGVCLVLGVGGPALLIALIPYCRLILPLERYKISWEFQWMIAELWLQSIVPNAELRKSHRWLMPYYSVSFCIVLASGVLLPLVVIWIHRVR